MPLAINSTKSIHILLFSIDGEEVVEGKNKNTLFAIDRSSSIVSPHIIKKNNTQPTFRRRRY